MSRLRGKFLGIPLVNPPKDELQRHYAESVGFREVAPGRWVMPNHPNHVSLEVLRSRGPGHACKACGGFFRSAKARDAYCLSCRAIMSQELARFTGILRSAKGLPLEEQKKAVAKLEIELRCPDCGWIPNESGCRPTTLSGFVEILPALIRKAHVHLMRHVYPDRFYKKSKRFKVKGNQTEEDAKLTRKLDRLARKMTWTISYPTSEESSES